MFVVIVFVGTGVGTKWIILVSKGCMLNSRHFNEYDIKPWYRKHGKKHGIYGETMVSPCSPCFSCFPMLCKSMGIFSGHISRAWISMETMGHHLLVILNSMEKHGKHGALFSHDFRQHGKAWGAW